MEQEGEIELLVKKENAAHSLCSKFDLMSDTIRYYRD